MGILIGADLVPTHSNIELFIDGKSDELVGHELNELLAKADFRIFNLEVPLTDIESPIKKQGPNLIAPRDTINGYKKLGVNILTLANNHILDQGFQGLKSTLEILENNGISYFGVGENLWESSKPFVFEYGDKKIGLYACAEHEFSIATETSAGANPFDPLETPDHVCKLKEQCDYVIVLYHGGKEQYRYPSPNLQKRCRKLVEKGADIVICQHSHCIGCKEEYLNGTIVYGQGNFLFDRNDNEFWRTGLLVEIDRDFNVSYIPIEKKENVVRLATEESSKAILADFFERSEKIKQKDFINNEYKKIAAHDLDGYLFGISGIKRSFIFRVLNKLTGYRLTSFVVKRKYKKTKLLAVENIIECEAHREMLLYGIKQR